MFKSLKRNKLYIPFIDEQIETLLQKPLLDLIPYHFPFMDMNENNLPPADAPDWGGPYNFAWFKYHHFEQLKTSAKAITNEYKIHPLGKALAQDAIKRFLTLTDQFIQLSNWLPDSGGGQGEMRKIIDARKKFESDYLNKELNGHSYWHAQEIDMMATDILNYMDTMCEDE